MGTIKPFNVDEMRSKAAEHIHNLFKNAVMIQAIYKDTFVKATARFADGVTEHVMVFYRDIDRKPMQYGQHNRAMEYINSIPERPWAS